MATQRTCRLSRPSSGRMRWLVSRRTSETLWVTLRNTCFTRFTCAADCSQDDNLTTQSSWSAGHAAWARPSSNLLFLPRCASSQATTTHGMERASCGCPDGGAALRCGHSCRGVMQRAVKNCFKFAGGCVSQAVWRLHRALGLHSLRVPGSGHEHGGSHPGMCSADVLCNARLALRP